MELIYKFKIGSINCCSLKSNSREVDVRTEFLQLEQDNLLQAMNQCGYTDFTTEVGFNNLFFQHAGRTVLVDCGDGNDELINSLAQLGKTAEDIDLLIITHSDFDHIGGLDLFKNAEIVFPKQAYDAWTTTAVREQMLEDFKRVFSVFLDIDFVAKGVEYREDYGSQKLPSLWKRMRLVEAEEEILPGVRLVYTPGHRPDHYAVEINSENETLLHIADGFRHKVQFHNPNWHTIYDSNPDQTAESLLYIIQRALSKKATLYGSHFTFPGLATVTGNSISFNSDL